MKQLIISLLILLAFTIGGAFIGAGIMGWRISPNSPTYHGFLSGYSFTEDNFPYLHKYWISMTVLNPQTQRVERVNLWSDSKPALHIITDNDHCPFAEFITSSRQGELLSIKYSAKTNLWETWTKPKN